MKRFAAKTIKYSFISLLAIVLVVVAAAASIFWKPALLINVHTFKMAKPLLSEAGIKITGPDPVIQISSMSLTRKELLIHATSTCVQVDGILDTCLDELRVQVQFSFAKPVIKIEKTGALVAAGRYFHLDIPPPRAPKKVDKHSDLVRHLFPDDWERLAIGPVTVDFKDVRVHDGETVITGRARVAYRPLTVAAAGDPSWNLGIDTAADILPVSLKGAAKLQLTGTGHVLAGPGKLDGIVSVENRITKAAKAKITADWNFKKDTVAARVSSGNVCLKETPILGCIKSLDVGANGKFDLKRLEVDAVQPLKIVTGNLKIASGTASQKEEPKKSEYAGGKPSLLPEIFSRLIVRDVHVNIPDLAIPGEKATQHVRMNMNSIPSAKTAWALKQTVDLSGSLKGRGAFFIKGDGEILSLDGGVTLKPDPDSVLRSNVAVSVTSNAAKAELSGRYKIKNYVFGIDPSSPCKIEMRLSGRAAVDDVHCPVHFSSTKPFFVSDLPRVGPLIEANVDGKVVMPYPPAANDPWDGRVAVHFKPISNKTFDFKADARVVLDQLKLADHPLDHIHIDDDIDFVIKDFGRFVDETYESPLAAPAPINALKGRLEFASHGKWIDSHSRIPFILTTKMASPGQTFNISALGSIGGIVRRNHDIPDLNITADLDDVQLAIPRLGLAKPPPVLPDPRIQAGFENPEIKENLSSPKFNYFIKMKTKKPVRFISNRAKAPVPVDAELTLATGEPLKGTVDVREFPLELFRRDARVNYLHLELKGAKAEDNPVSGDLQLTLTDYVVHALLSGTLEHTEIKLQSEPPLEENQILAVAIFGRDPNTLNTQQNQSVGNMQAALADKALALSSLYFLASTPIESIGYDAQEKVFTAKVHLGQGVSLDIGSGGSDIHEVGLNKSLGNSWMIHTYLTNPSGSGNQSATAFLERLFRY